MVSEVAQVEPRLKEILYRCVEQVRATKAALYIAGGANGTYELVTHYGFGDYVRRTLGSNDAVLDRLTMRRAAFFVNGINAEPRFSEILFSAQTDRILVAPLYSRGRLLGVLDLRDKAGRQPFEPADLDAARRIADQFIEFFAQHGLLGAEAVPLDESAGMEGSATATKIIEQARVAVTRDVSKFRPAPPTLTDGDLSALRDVLPAALNIAAAQVVAFSAFGHIGNLQLIAARAPMSDAALEHFQNKLAGWVRSRGWDVDPGYRNTMLYPYGTSGGQLAAAQLGSILSAPVSAGGMKGLVLTVAFESQPDVNGRKQLEQFLHIVQHVVQSGGAVRKIRATRQKAAEKLLEPDFQRYPELMEHSRKVSLLADQFAHYVGMPEDEVETIRLAGLLHDVGMRLLDYSRLYRKTNITAEELRLLREHPTVGAALVEPIFGQEMAFIVLSHHERADGRGYPSGIAGEAIPTAGRIVQICEAFDAMTSPHSYQAPMSEEAALKQVLRMGGAEFDHTLAVKFKEMIGH